MIGYAARWKPCFQALLVVSVALQLLAVGCTTEPDDTSTTQQTAAEQEAVPEAEPEPAPWVGTWTVNTEASLDALDDLDPALVDLTRSIYDGTLITLTEEHYAAIITVLGEERPFRFPMTAEASSDNSWALTVDTPDGPKQGTLSMRDENNARLITPEGAALTLVRSEEQVAPSEPTEEGTAEPAD